MKLKVPIALFLFTVAFLEGVCAAAYSQDESAHQEYGAPEDPNPPLVEARRGKEITAQEEELLRRGNLIVAAIKKFRAENGFYPSSLRELAPKYIKKIPQSPFPDYWKWTGLFFGMPRAKFRYDLENANGELDIRKAPREEIHDFFLHCRYNFDEEFFYSSHDNAWHYKFH